MPLQEPAAKPATTCNKTAPAKSARITLLRPPAAAAADELGLAGQQAAPPARGGDRQVLPGLVGGLGCGELGWGAACSRAAAVACWQRQSMSHARHEGSSRLARKRLSAACRACMQQASFQPAGGCSSAPCREVPTPYLPPAHHLRPAACAVLAALPCLGRAGG